MALITRDGPELFHQSLCYGVLDPEYLRACLQVLIAVRITMGIAYEHRDVSLPRL